MAFTLTSPTDVVGRLYGDLDVEEAVRIQQKMLPNVQKNLITARFATSEEKARNEGHIVRFRRYEKLPYGDQPLSEGVTPNWDSLEQRIVSCELKQYGRFITMTDIMGYFGQQSYEQIASEQQAIQAAEQMEYLAFKKFRAGSNVFRSEVDTAGTGTDYLGVASRSQINAPVNSNLIAKALRALEEEDAEKITDILNASADISTTPIRPSFVAVCHPNLRVDLEAIDEFVPVEKYSNASVAFPGEMGAYKGVRFVQSTIYEPWKGAGAPSCTSPARPMLETGGNSDVYPICIYAKNSVGQVTLGGLNSIIPVVHRPDSPSKDDPLNQRGSIGYKYMYACLVLRDEFLMRLEVACSEL